MGTIKEYYNNQYLAELKAKIVSIDGNKIVSKLSRNVTLKVKVEMSPFVNTFIFSFKI